MPTSRIEHLKHHVEARERAIQRRLSAAAAAPKGHPARAHHKAEADRLATEASAIRATVDFHKSADTLASDIERQQVKVEYLLQALKTAHGTKKLQLKMLLHKESLRLREMLAAAKLKASLPPTVAEEQSSTSTLPAVALVPQESPAEDAAASAPAAPENVVHLPPPAPRPGATPLLPDSPPDPYISSYRSHERFWSRIPAMEFNYSGAEEDDSDPWYKNPLVGIGIGLAVGWYLGKKA